MKVSELIEKLQKAKSEYGDIDVKIECDQDKIIYTADDITIADINTVAYVDPNGRCNSFGHIRLTAGDTDDIFYIYDEDPEDAEDMDVVEIN